MLDWTPARSDVVLSLWVRNLTDENYWAQWVDSGDVINAIPGDPRTIGVSATVGSVAR